MTPQGRAIKQAAVDFGNGQTLPFTPCKKGFIPIVDGQKRVACPLHNGAREKRLAKDRWKIRLGEMDPSVFWKSNGEKDVGASPPEDKASEIAIPGKPMSKKVKMES